MLTKSNVSSFTLVPILFVLTLFLLLSALSVSVIMAGGAVYEKISDDMDGNYDRRVAFSYLTTKIRQNDSYGNISAENKDGMDMLAIKEIYGSDEFVTYIYYYDGYVRELFLEVIDGKPVGLEVEIFDDSDSAPVTDNKFKFDWGEKIIQVEGFEFNFDENGGKIEMRLTDREGGVQSTIVSLRSQG